MERAAKPLRNGKIATVNMVGGPGCGKTTLIDATVDRFMPEVHVGVIACDPVTHRDADRLLRHSEQIAHVNTGDNGIVNAEQIGNALRSLDLAWLDLLFIENVGALTNAACQDLGQDATAVVFSVAAGDDKAVRHPGIVRTADVILLNKFDLIGSVPFDLTAFHADVQRINPGIEVIELSALHGQGIERWLDWLRKRLKPAEVCGQVSHWFG